MQDVTAPEPAAGGVLRVLSLTRARLRGALSVRVLAAPLVALVAVELLGLAGDPSPAAVAMVTSVGLALPLLGWLARQVLDAEPDEQALLSSLAVGGATRGVLAGLLAASCVTVPAALVCAGASLLGVDGTGVRADVVVAGSALAAATALAAVGVGAYAARSVAGRGAAPVVVLVAAPVLVAVLGLTGSPVVTALVPRLLTAVRAANARAPDLRTPAQSFLDAAPGVVAQVLLWSLVVLALRLLLARRRT